MNKKLFLIIATLFLLFNCKKSESLDNDIDKPLDNVKSEVSDGENIKIKELSGKLGGKIIENIKMFDANIKQINGMDKKLSDYKNKVIFLNLWATWCPPCREEMPSIEKLYNEYKNTDLAFVAVSQGENEDTVKKFLKNNKYTFPIFIDHRGEVSKSYSSGSIPTTYIIDKNGYVILQFVGGRDWNSPEVKELLNEVLK